MSVRRGTTILTLPAEVRTLIWSYLNHNTCIHILQDGRSICQSNDLKKICPGPHHCHMHTSNFDMKCESCTVGQYAALAMTCQQLHTELVPELYRHLSFVSAETFFSFVSNKLATGQISQFALSWLTTVHLDIGPAKYADPATNLKNRAALKVIAAKATNLRVLKLTMQFHHCFHVDIFPIRIKTLQLLLRFRNLNKIQLRLQAPPPGPIGISNNQFLMVAARDRVDCLEEILIDQLCQKRKQEIEAGNVPQYFKVSTIRHQVRMKLQERAKLRATARKGNNNSWGIASSDT